ncbi:hypothetical protein AX769_02505 [Frondihabitans sp. PAMC 28766]|uniref:hypothetical protein n=1 Tax=Frondihabitans sp. PAMC 28766 TaxID=1795630 RepID=UPI00078B5567|nr:hypothetical protein [Frondihabitans sp. PAMC 28766]AMM19209.1 hypothetical protein AX769_02505 [Frondihabitans sp. PAMC 28766]
MSDQAATNEPSTGPGDTAFLRLTGRGTNALFALFAVVHLALAVYGLRNDLVPVFALVSLALVLAAGFLLTRAPADRLPLRLTIAVVVLTTLASLDVFNLPDRGWPGWATWIWGAVTFVLFMLAMRGRTLWAWIGFASMTALTEIWCIECGRGALMGFNFVVRSAALVLVVSLFALFLTRTRARIRLLQMAEIDRVRDEASATAALEEQNVRLAQLRALATPALEKILSDDELNDDDRRSFRVVEASLRDQLRATGLASTAVAEAATRARHRGVDVSLLDDRDGAEVPGAVKHRIEAVLVEHLDAATTGGRVVARLLPDGRDTVATVLATDGDDTQRVTIASG